MAKVRAVQVAQAGGSLELVERDVPEPARGEVRVRIEACGVCHGDSLTVEGQWPGLTYPRIPGHEIAVHGRLIVIGVGAEPIEVTSLQLIGGSRSIVGHAAGASIDSQARTLSARCRACVR
jgi:D-arabinose 1-dehydrogenase-like Zn-dependent alcohol dehydrogenase